MKRNILVILPHPDDEAFGLSGTLAKHINEGTKVTYACLTLGEMGRNMGIPPFANRVTLPQVRKVELEDSCRAIGIEDFRMLGYHDKTIEFVEHGVLDADIEALVNELEPSIIYTFYPGYAVHPDHDATGAAVIRTIGRMPVDQRPAVRCLAFSNGHRKAIGSPDIAVDVREFLHNKMESIKSHRSQFQAAEMLGNKDYTDQEIQDRFGTEHFWTYQFNE